MMIRDDLAASVRQTAAERPERANSHRGYRPVDCATTKRQLERAVRGIDVFPRCALVLSSFENVPIQDAVILLDAEPALIRKAQAIGVLQLNRNLAGHQNPRTIIAPAHVAKGEVQHVRT